ncbi:MAG: hypothetical protein SGJ11_04055 [Phycisphaerae bacterium]|nr:hypothetical protein [Phycisphaerae bacterium]
MQFESPVVVYAPPGFVVQADIDRSGLAWDITILNIGSETVSGCVDVQWRVPERARDHMLALRAFSASDSSIEMDRSFRVDEHIILHPEAWLTLWLGERICLELKVGQEVVISGAASSVFDVDGDGTVAANDLAEVLSAWGPLCGPADVNMDGGINLLDLMLVLDAIPAS